jgi:hypothetical protein
MLLASQKLNGPSEEDISLAKKAALPGLPALAANGLFQTTIISCLEFGRRRRILTTPGSKNNNRAFKQDTGRYYAELFLS